MDAMENLEQARVAMRDAFVEMGMLALRAGVDQDDNAYLTLHGRFFDANIEIKKAMSGLSEEVD